MRIKEHLTREVIKQIDKIYNNKPKKKEKKLNEHEIKELMSHSYYKRGKGGAIKQKR